MNIEQQLANVPHLDYVHQTTRFDGPHVVLRFTNGFGASIVSNTHSYGVELAVLKWLDERRWDIRYDTPITDDVLGHLDKEQLHETLVKIAELPKEDN